MKHAPLYVYLCFDFFFEGIGSGCGSVGFAVAGLAVHVSSNVCL